MFISTFEFIFQFSSLNYKYIHKYGGNNIE